MSNAMTAATFHECHGVTPSRAYGPAVEHCYSHADGTLWVSNGEYESQVSFCPFCGFEAQVKPELLT